MSAAGVPRANHLTDPLTSRDLFGLVRGHCTGCTSCGKYLIDTKKKYTSSVGDASRKHPDNDPSITHCSRCGCPPELHIEVVHETERELGSDAFALRQWDTAVLHYSRAIELHPTDATLWSNRSAAYLAKNWHSQALHDAEHAISLRPDWARPWGRKAAALLGLGNAAAAVEAYRTALRHNASSTALQRGLQDAERAVQRNPRAARSASANVKSVPQHPTTSSACGAAASANASQRPPLPQQPTHERQLQRPSASPALVPPQPASVGRPTTAASPSPAPAERVLQLWAATQEQYERVMGEMAELQRRMGELEVAVQQTQLSTGLAGDGSERLDAVNGAAVDVGVDRAERVVGAGSSAHSAHGDFSEDRAAATGDGAVSCCRLGSSGSEAPTPEEQGAPRDKGTEGPGTTAPEAGSPQLCGEWEAAGASHPSENGDGPSAASSQGSVGSETSSAEGLVDVVGAEGQQLLDSEGEAMAQGEEQEAAWLAGVGAARRALGQSASGMGFVPPPTSAASARRTRVPPAATQFAADMAATKAKKEAGAAEAEATHAAPGLTLGSLQGLLLAAAARRRRVDPTGTPRAACKRYGCAGCAQYVTAVMDLVAGPERDLAAALQRARLCTSCGCDCGDHETEKEAALREAQERRAQHRQERLRRAHEAAASAAATAAAPEPRSAVDATNGASDRVAAATARRQAAAAAGEQLQELDCDVLTQSRRGMCTTCGDRCPGFCIFYRTVDANDPEIMFYCSLCGCRAEAHAVDAEWRRAEAARKAAEAQHAAQARHPSAFACVGARREEAEAYAALGLHFGADKKAVVTAYKRLALRLHPDKRRRGSEGPEADDDDADRFLRITQAYKLLQC